MTTPMTTPRRSASLAVRLSTHVLPAGQVRDRYQQELLAELYALDRPRQLRFAAGALSCARSLRRAVMEENDMARESALRTVPLHCRLHLWHRYRKASTEDGQTYRRCVDCGKDHTGDIDAPGEGIIHRGLPMG